MEISLANLVPASCLDAVGRQHLTAIDRALQELQELLGQASVQVFMYARVFLDGKFHIVVQYGTPSFDPTDIWNSHQALFLSWAPGGEVRRQAPRELLDGGQALNEHARRVYEFFGQQLAQAFNA